MLILLREGGKHASWWWSTESGEYAKRESGKITRLTTQEYLADITEDGLESNRCDGLQKWIEAGRSR